MGDFERMLRLRSHSAATCKSYLHHVKKFLTRCGDPRQADEAAIGRYLLELVDAGRSRPYVNQAVSAIKFLYRHVVRSPRVVTDVPRPRIKRSLPTVLSRDELLHFLHQVYNVKHRAIVLVAYSAGLRVSEVVSLRCEDLDLRRGMVRVQGKGGKVRYSVLSEVAAATIGEYRKWIQTEGWVFPGGRAGTHLTARSVQKVVTQAARRSGLEKRITPHVLRHSFATHCLEDGIDLRYIQELLGHKRPETTMIYTRVARADIRRIQSPLDRIYDTLKTLRQPQSTRMKPRDDAATRELHDSPIMSSSPRVRKPEGKQGSATKLRIIRGWPWKKRTSAPDPSPTEGQ